MTQKRVQEQSKISTEQTSSMSGSVPIVKAGRGGSDSTSPSVPLSKDRHATETTNNSTNVIEMSSTDSAGNSHGASCSLVSTLLPSSCRGSAEAFARCLHRRLTSLGENGSPERTSDASKPHETSWLHPSASNRHVTTKNLAIKNQHSILQHQPRHNSESDLYYDIEMGEDDDESGSPAEEATAADLANFLVNPEILKANHYVSSSGIKMTAPISAVHRDPESGYLFASPITGTPPDSDSSEMFFDLVSSDVEKLKDEIFFDPINTSDSEITSDLSNISASANPNVMLGHKRTDTNSKHFEDTSESSCSSRNKSYENRNRQKELVCSSEDSLNGRSSQETTSPSHESLWSTFDDSTMSLQDESPPRTICDSVLPHICLPKSHSDSELPSNGIRTVESKKLDRWNEEEEMNEHNIDEDNFVNEINISENVMQDIRNSSLPSPIKDTPIKEDYLKQGTEDLISNVEDEEKRTEFTEFNIMPNNASHLKMEEDTVVNNTDTDHSTSSSTFDIPDALECSNNIKITELTPKNELELQISNDNAFNNVNTDEERLCLLLKKLGNSSNAKEDNSPLEQDTQSETVEEEEEEEEEDRPQRVRRCSSLKTGKTPPGTPRRKKIVRFADKLGLDLADVRTFLDEIPKIPNSAYNDLIYDDIFRPQDPSNTENAALTGDDWCDRYQDDSRRRSTSSIPTRKIDRLLVPLFQQPGGMANFLDVVRERRVCLENVLVQDPVTLAIQGTVRVINLDFHKSVHIRYTLNSWRNFSDLQATYVSNSCDGFSDKFSFVLYCHTLMVGQKLEFAVRFQCKGTQYWDNNAGANYCFQCLPALSSAGYIPITSDENRRESWFY